MAITVCGNCIGFGGSYTLCSATPGFIFDGVIKAAEGFCDTRLFGGTVSGYMSGADPSQDTIDKFPFASDSNATDVGELTQARSGAGQSSSESGYTSGGEIVNTIDKFPFASDSNATDVGNLTQARGQTGSGQSSKINGSGYTSGGLIPGINETDTIDKFPFAADANATDVGELTQARRELTGQSSLQSGYASGGVVGPPFVRQDRIDKFPFAADANATDVGNLTQARSVKAGQSSSESGYTSGGYAPPVVNTIDKFPFAADGNATDVGELSSVNNSASGQSSTVNGYTSGGASGCNSKIDKFPFAVNAPATCVGDLTQGRNGGAGQQV